MNNLIEIKKYEFNDINNSGIVIQFTKILKICSLQLAQIAEKPEQKDMIEIGIIPEEFRPNNQISFCSDAEIQNSFLEIKISTNGSISYKRRQSGIYSYATVSYITK